MKSLDNQIRNATSLMEAVAGLTLASSLLLAIFPQSRPYGFLTGGFGVGAYASSVLSRKRVLEVSTRHVADFEKEHKAALTKLTADLNERTTASQHLQSQLAQAENTLLKVQVANSTASKVQGDLQGRVEELLTKTTALETEIKEQVEIVRSYCYQALEDWSERLNQLIEHYEKYPECEGRLAQYAEEIDTITDSYLSQLSSATDLSELIEIFHAITQDFDVVKTKLRKSSETIRYQAKYLECEELEETLEALQRQQADQIAKLHANYKAVISEFQVDYQRFQQDALKLLEEARDCSSYDEFVSQIKDTIAQLTQQLETARKPHRFPALLEAHRIGNALIDFYYKQGIILDGCDYETTDTGFRLWFYYDRNSRYVALEELNTEKALPQIKQLTSALNEPKFVYSDRSTRLCLDVQTTHPKRKEVDLARLTTSVEVMVEKVFKEMSRKSTVRIMGATGGGKGVAARFLVSQIVKRETWYIRLHDPQHGSAEDYWGIPKVSKSGSEMQRHLEAITAQMHEREFTKVHAPVTLDILDEIDTQLERTDKEQFIDLISRIRHLGMKLFLIGQNPKVGRAGLQWSDLAQMTCIYMMESALEAINNYPALEHDREKLSKQYHEINREIETRNEPLDDAKKYYFGLCVIPSKSPMWFVLPPADAIKIECDSKLLAKTFLIPNSLLEFLDNKNYAQSPSPTALTNSNVVSLGPGLGKPEMLMNQGLQLAEQAERSDSPMQGSTAQAAQTALDALTSCKTHPEARLRLCKDGRFYCPSCRKKLGKSELV